MSIARRVKSRPGRSPLLLKSPSRRSIFTSFVTGESGESSWMQILTASNLFKLYVCQPKTVTQTKTTQNCRPFVFGEPHRRVRAHAELLDDSVPAVVDDFNLYWVLYLLRNPRCGLFLVISSFPLPDIVLYLARLGRDADADEVRSRSDAMDPDAC
jgi:hypothetical protein